MIEATCIANQPFPWKTAVLLKSPINHPAQALNLREFLVQLFYQLLFEKNWIKDRRVDAGKSYTVGIIYEAGDQGKSRTQQDPRTKLDLLQDIAQLMDDCKV